MSQKETSKAKQVLNLASNIASENKNFHTALGSGAGDRATLEFMRQLRRQATKTFRHDFSEQKICGKTAQAVDFYFPDEETIVEVALGLKYPNSEFEKDILKAIMAKGQKHRVRLLFFISRPGATKKCAQPGRKAFMEWVRSKHGIQVEIHEIGAATRSKK